MQVGLGPERWDAPLAGGESVDRPVGHGVVGAPCCIEDVGVEVGIVGPGAGLCADDRDLGVREPVGDQAAVEGGGDRPGSLADDDDLIGVRVVFGEVVQGRGAVDVAVVFDGQRVRVLLGDVAEVRVARAAGHIDERVIGERVVIISEVEDAVLVEVAPGTVGLQVPVVELVFAGRAGAGEGTARRVPADTAAVQKQHDLGRIGQPVPESELTPIGAVAVASRHDLFPRGVRVGRGIAISDRAPERNTPAHQHHDSGRDRDGELPAAQVSPTASHRVSHRQQRSYQSRLRDS